MGRIKTYSWALIMGILSVGQTNASDAHVKTFADCAGRLSALMEHQWLFSDPDANRTQNERAAMISLLEAVMPEDAARQVLAYRIEAKQAQAVLLTRATFNEDRQDAAWALARSDAEIGACRSLMLG